MYNDGQDLIRLEMQTNITDEISGNYMYSTCPTAFLRDSAAGQT